MLNLKFFLVVERYSHNLRQKDIIEKLNKYSNCLVDYILQRHSHQKAVKDIFGKQNLFFDKAITTLNE